jgi:hypothetical protein
LAWVHVPKEKQKALDDRAAQGISFEYSGNCSFKVIVKSTRTIMVARDALFHEKRHGFGFQGSSPKQVFFEEDERSLSMHIFHVWREDKYICRSRNPYHLTSSGSSHVGSE